MQRSAYLVIGAIIGLGAWTAMGATFQLITTEMDAGEGGTVERQEIVTDSHRFGLKLPARWGVQLVASNQSLLILEPNLRAGIQLRFWPEEGQGKEELSSWLKRLEDRLDGAVMVGQFRARSATAEGWGFDMIRAVDRTTRAGLRVILVPYPGGMAEFELRAPASEVADYYRILRHLVGSFTPRRVADAERGKAGRGGQ